MKWSCVLIDNPVNRLNASEGFSPVRYNYDTPVTWPGTECLRN
jgi:hypothetical protein